MENLKSYTDFIENKLCGFLPPASLRQGRVIKAAEHSLSAGGKRIRAVLVLVFCEMCGGSRENALPAACAVEYMHTFSLIHDDLPCMDDDDLRRGKPSCHKAFDESTALLAGDALAVAPFGIIAEAAHDGLISAQAAVKITAELSKAAGFLGMVGGQQIDTENSNLAEPDDIIGMYALKTGALLRAACRCGVLCAGSGGEARFLEAAGAYGENLGLAFQLIDDILDIEGSEEKLGKPTGSDKKSGKSTYAAVRGIEQTRREAGIYTKLAISALSAFEESAEKEFIVSLTKTLLGRSS